MIRLWFARLAGGLISGLLRDLLEECLLKLLDARDADRDAGCEDLAWSKDLDNLIHRVAYVTGVMGH